MAGAFFALPVRLPSVQRHLRRVSDQGGQILAAVSGRQKAGQPVGRGHGQRPAAGLRRGIDLDDILVAAHAGEGQDLAEFRFQLGDHMSAVGAGAAKAGAAKTVSMAEASRVT